MSESAPAIAAVITDYFCYLTEHGLERKEALELVRDYQQELLESQRERPEDAA